MTERTKSKVGSEAELWVVEQVSQSESVGASPLRSRWRRVFATGYMTFVCCWCFAKKDQTKRGKAEGVEKDWRMYLEAVTGMVSKEEEEGDIGIRRGGPRRVYITIFFFQSN